MREIYLDNAAATPVDPRVQREMVRALHIVGNPSSFNDAGRRAAAGLHHARKIIARFLGAHMDEVVLASSGSEANTLAVQGIARADRSRRSEIVTSSIEHVSVLGSVCALSCDEHEVRWVSVDAQGLISPEDIKKVLSPKTLLVSVMYANNEIGTIEPIREIGKLIRAFRKEHRTPYPFFHTDACQAAGYLSMDVNQLGVDLLTMNSSKIYGPAGVGVLFVRRGVPLTPLILGGEQERGLRAGTENLPAILGFARAVTLVRRAESKGIAALRDSFLRRLCRVVPESRVNGPVGQKRLANNVNISIPGLVSEELLIELDRYGIRAGSGSACTAHSVEPSHVLRAIGVKKPYLDGALRFSLGRQTTPDDVEHVVNTLGKVTRRLQERHGNILK